MRADPDVEYAEVDQRRYPHAVPNDPRYVDQWYLQNVQPSATHAEAAWDLGVGTDGVVIAVLDTGVLFDHPDLKRMVDGGRLLPGYDFIADEVVANDGNGRDPDAADPGDWITAAENDSGPFAGCADPADKADSSWHGTRVAGIIGALSNNAVGISGTTWAPWILPVRVIGKCGGYDSDILLAMAWAAGLHVNGVPDNPYPAKIENLSLGSAGTPCPRSYQDLIAQLTNLGVAIVVSAGNENGPVDAPANCAGVAAVVGLRHTGTKVGYSSMGPEVAVGAPGGNCVNVGGGPCLFSIDTTSSNGATAPGAYTYTDKINYNVGTSFSAPIVSGIVGLMASANANLSVPQLIVRLRESATPYPVDSTLPICPATDQISGGCNCTTSTCGAGMANAENALKNALRPIAVLTAPSQVTSGQTVPLSAVSSSAANGRIISSYLWEVVSGQANLTSTNSTTTSLVAPNSGSVAIRLTITDDVGRQDTAQWSFAAITVSVSPTAANVQAAGGSVTFNAAVVNAQNAGVSWQVDGATGGNASVGTISAMGTYTAPANVPTPSTVTVTAVSIQDPTRTASAQVTITAPPAPAVPPPTTSSGGGGGGGGGAALDLLFLICSICLGRRFVASIRV